MGIENHTQFKVNETFLIENEFIIIFDKEKLVHRLRNDDEEENKLNSFCFDRNFLVDKHSFYEFNMMIAQKLPW